MTVESVAAAFASYRAEVIPAAAPAVQVEECRRAFYAGSYSMLMNVANGIGDDSTSEDDGVAQLEALKTECEAFAVALGAGQAPPVPPIVAEPDRSTPIVTDPHRSTPIVTDPGSYNVRSAEVEPALREIAELVKPLVPTGYGFTLLIFSYGQTGLRGEGPAGSLFYISTAARADMVKAMREFIARNVQ